MAAPRAEELGAESAFWDCSKMRCWRAASNDWLLLCVVLLQQRLEARVVAEGVRDGTFGGSVLAVGRGRWTHRLGIEYPPTLDHPLAAAVIPAQRAARLDAMSVLRIE